MRRPGTALAAGVVVLVLLAAVAARSWRTADRPQDAAGWRCTGTVHGRDTVGAVRVPRGRTCRFDDVHQTGPVQVDDGATLVVNRSTVLGDLGVAGARRLDLQGTTVTGELRMPAPRDATVVGNVFGSVRAGRAAGRLVIRDNVVQTTLDVAAAPGLDCRHNLTDVGGMSSACGS